MKIIFRKSATYNFVVLDEICHWLKLMYLFLRHVVYVISVSGLINKITLQAFGALFQIPQYYRKFLYYKTKMFM
jgi:hypothetical protein